MRARRRTLATLMALAMAGLPAACGEDDVDRGVDRATDEAGKAGRQVEDEAGEVKRGAEKEIKD